MLTVSVSCAEVYEEVMRFAMRVLPSPVHNSLALALSLHAHSPTIEMHNQVCVCVFV